MQQFLTVCFLSVLVFTVLYLGILRNIIDTRMAVSLLLVFVTVFSIIVVWVYSLIRSLKDLSGYTGKLKKGNASFAYCKEDEIKEVGDAVKDMHEELQKQSLIREEMIQNISHDLKTPIATIKSYCESIKDGIYPYGTAEKSIDVIYEHADRLEKKVYSLITYNKVGYLSDKGTDADTLISVLLERIVPAYKARDEKIKLNIYAEKEVSFKGEEEAWRACIENLLDNGFRYALSEITVTLRNDYLEIYNDGEKIDTESIDRLFRPYEMGNKGKFGLGLSIVRKVCDTYGYDVRAENREKGVAFVINKRNTGDSDVSGD